MSIEYNAGLTADALRGVADTAEANELAHLAATSKVEHCVRDRMAWWLTKALAAEPAFVVREWRRVDLAVIQDDEPVSPLLLIEGKAHYHFDVWDGGAARYAALVERDLTTRRVKWPDATVTAVVLSTHLGAIPERLVVGGVIAYAAAANRLLREFDNDADAARDTMRAEATTAYSKLGTTIGPIPVATGRAWGYDVHVDGWVIEPTP